MAHTLPIALRNTLKQEVREILTKLSEFFYKISQKVIDPKTLDELQNDVVETIYKMEMTFPPSFFDIMV